MKSILILSLFIFSFAHGSVKNEIRIDGSSTVFPISEAVAEEFGRANKGVRVTVGTSGTGGGFKKFILGEIDINNASRSIKKSEADKAKANGVRYVELPVAYDGITIVVNKNNTWVDHITVKELHELWKPGSKVKTWKQLRADWPDKKILLYGPGPDSGTFDFFTEAINGKSQASRSNFTKSEDDNVLAQGVMGDTNAMGYFGYAYYVENKTKIRSVPIKVGNAKAVAPTLDTIREGTYKPLSRPMYIYVSDKAAAKPLVQNFIKFYMTEGPALVKEVGYVPMPKTEYTKALKLFETLNK